MTQKKVLVCGSNGFIGNNLVKKLREKNYYVAATDITRPAVFSPANRFVVSDLRNPAVISGILKSEEFDYVIQLAADSGGFTYMSGNNCANIVNNSAIINNIVASESFKNNVKSILFTSSSSVYPTSSIPLKESDAYPSNPEGEYGWEKISSERMYLNFNRNYNTDVKIARLFNTYGPGCVYSGGKEGVIASICRKVIEAPDGGSITLFGDGTQTRSFTYIDKCVDGLIKLMESDVNVPLNLGDGTPISINTVANLIIEISGKNLTINYSNTNGGSQARISDNTLINEKLDWEPSYDLEEGLALTYLWIEEQIQKSY